VRSNIGLVSSTDDDQAGGRLPFVVLQFVSKRHPEDVKEVVAWRRFSELKKLHGELAYTHRNLFRRQEEFPSFPRAQLFGKGRGCRPTVVGYRGYIQYSNSVYYTP